MKVSQAIAGYMEYHLANSKKNTIRNYEYTLRRFRDQFAERELGSITSDEILFFWPKLREDQNRQPNGSGIRC